MGKPTKIADIIFNSVFDYLSAHKSDRKSVGKLVLTREVHRLSQTEITAFVRVYEKSGFLGLKKRLLVCVRRNLSGEVVESNILHAARGVSYSLIEDVINGY